ncbi:P-loop containing nucleoside triphosphate hydrolase protein [Penicillium cf. griseofulvum]|uniref:P-loop containing nucleoside triphosphate hydrolase protein n=1 Tax=Penicillium cf. griseofulvum TaxID=2972120 RepID=A0A9W9T2S0_9EURO|nr:P-loop containing nucleoside triphosphate hydrolase protein [Penicillium cf. griseofulvum]KAJ5440349.1 P-loop containing nucleoside triphosphate hydrolase protein [Penicillium cf. griseofulvum]KAJ5448397.1 P-loop containing nucleoside triphosphate hydrolase protein [Penicillium cf. griseofulvum]
MHSFPSWTNAPVQYLCSMEIPTSTNRTSKSETELQRAFQTATGAFIGSFLVPYLSFLRHGRTIRPFDSLDMLLVVSLSIDLAQTTALHLTAERRCQPSGFNLSLLMVSQHWLDISLEETESIFHETLYWWTNYTPLTSDDLLPLPKALSSGIPKERMKLYCENRCKSYSIEHAAVSTLFNTISDSETRGKTCVGTSNPKMHTA